MKDTIEKRVPRNTTKEVMENPLLGLVTAMDEGGSGILAQEAQGQQSFVHSDTIPTDMRGRGDYNAKDVLEAAGVKFLGPVENDEMFQFVELPQGWKKVPTDHSMWSHLVDDKGRVRASIFYKAAFYDRSAHLGLSCRFSLSFDYDRFDNEHVGVTHVKDGNEVIYTTEPISAVEGEESWDVSDKANSLALDWLNAKYPDWENPGAYWD